VADLRARVARLRVPLGFLAGVLVLVLSRPTIGMLAAGTAIAMAGEAIRVWAAGHLEKSREVTRSGPYRWHRHPLYVGSTVMGIGIGVAAASLPAALLILIYLVTTYTAAIRTEEAYLRGRFGCTYDDYCAGRAAAVHRPFAWERVWRNKEWRAVVGIGLVFLVLAAKALLWPGAFALM
jgi:protein-S-isoprenylcysteine O-methyltransferase Ste14